MSAAAEPAFRAALEGIELIDQPVLLRQRSRDYYWYSPILKRALDGKAADLIAVPRDRDEVVRVAAACARFRVPLAVRGGATGNYGQMVPLEGGVLLDMARLDKTLGIENGRGHFEAGVRLGDADNEARLKGWELRMFPSTRRQATVGGYVSGGAAGVAGPNTPTTDCTLSQPASGSTAPASARQARAGSPDMRTRCPSGDPPLYPGSAPA